jgi:regulator of sirC expression with transglutaminase-like and TPR domain
MVVHDFEPDVLEGAFRIARAEYPDLDVAAYRARIEEFGREARARAGGKGRRAFARVNRYFFEDLGFRGNAEDYYDPRNSYLNEVIDRRRGIPITLSVLYCEVARRAGLSAYGVGFPGHFLVKCLFRDGEAVLDCFRGRVLTRDDCRALLESMEGLEGVAFSEELLAIASPREILSRMLNNLRRIHLERGDYDRALRWVELEFEFNPGAADPFRERGLIYARLERYGKALTDLEEYLRRAPEARDAAPLRGQVQLLRQILSSLN